MMKTVNFAIIGHGFIGHFHEFVLGNMEGARVVGIADRDKDMLEDVGEGIKRYESNGELFADPEVDVVIIAANNNQHLGLVLQAAEAGKDIICEKPVAMNSGELEEMIRVTEACGVKFTVHQQRRYDKDFRVMKKVLEEKRLGDVYTIQSSLYGYNGNMHDWHVFISEGGGMMFDWGVHLIDQILYMMPQAKVRTVFADVRNVINKEVDDYFKVLLRFDNNITAEIELGTYFLKNQDGWFERHWFIGGTTGTAYVDSFSAEGEIVRTSHLLTNVGLKKPMGAAGPTRSFGTPAEGTILTEKLPEVEDKEDDILFYTNYLKAYHGEEEFLVKIPETARVMRVMEAARESARTGKSVDFE